MSEKKEVSEREILVAMVAGEFMDWLEQQGRKYGELGKILGINSKTLKTKILENAKEAIQIAKASIRSGSGEKWTAPYIDSHNSLRYTLERKILLLLITHSCFEWLKGLGERHGEMAKIMGIPSKEGKLKILDIAEEAVEVIKTKYPISAPQEEGRSAS